MLAMAHLIYLSGTCKLNMNCTTGLKVSTTADGKFNVEACPMELQHIWLSKEEWQEIASKIQQAVPADKILDVIHQSMPNNLHRHRILDKKDINNITQAYGLREIQHHPNDHE